MEDWKKERIKGLREVFDKLTTEDLSTALVKVFCSLDMMQQGYWLAMKNLKEEDEEKHKEEIQEWEDSITNLQKIINTIRLSKGKIDIELLGKDIETYDFYDFEEERMQLTDIEVEGDLVVEYNERTMEEESLDKVKTTLETLTLLKLGKQMKRNETEDSEEKEELTNHIKHTIELIKELETAKEKIIADIEEKKEKQNEKTI